MTTPFALATLDTAAGPRAALRVADRYHLLDEGESVLSLLRSWDESLPRLGALAAARSGEPGLPAAEAVPLTPVRHPDKLVAVGANYSGHLEEMGLEAKRWATMPFFLRPPTTTLVGPGRTVRIPRSTRRFDWECELAVVVGRRLRHADRGEATAAIAGYMVGLDMSCRDLIQVDNDLKVDLARGKAQDTMAPCGPALVPACFLPDVGDLRITLDLNGERMMDASTAEMLYGVDEQLSLISGLITLEPGDILFTGSPSGSAGAHGGRWLRAGDRIRAEIAGVGVLEVEMLDD